MLTFRLYHTLHLQYEELLRTVFCGAELSGLYSFIENKLIVESSDGRISGFDFKTGALEDCSASELKELQTESPCSFEVEPNMEIAELFKFLFAILKRNLGIEPYADNYMLDVLCRKLNQRLVRYNGHCFLGTDDVVLLKASDEKGEVSLEKLIKKVKIGKEASDEVYATYLMGQRERKFCRFEDADKYFQKVLSAEKKDSILYQEASFGMGEVFYFTGRLKEAVECYRRCNPNLVEKGQEVFLRLGYCLEEMRNASEKMRIYTKCRLNGKYMAEHKSMMSEDISPAEFEDYSRLCEKLGEEDWKKSFENG